MLPLIEIFKTLGANVSFIILANNYEILQGGEGGLLYSTEAVCNLVVQIISSKSSPLGIALTLISSHNCFFIFSSCFQSLSPEEHLTTFICPFSIFLNFSRIQFET